MATIQSKTFKGQPWVLKTTRKRDDLRVLSEAYKVPVRDIVEANDVVWSGDSQYVARRLAQLDIPSVGRSAAELIAIVRSSDINEWVAKIGGTCVPTTAPGFKVAKAYDRPVRGCDAGGWALFNDKTTIWLPAKTRVGDEHKAKPRTAPKAAQVKPDSGLYWVGGALVLLGALYWYKGRGK